MKIKILQSIGGADFSYSPKEVAEVPDELAKSWIKAGAAEAIEPVKEPEKEANPVKVLKVSLPKKPKPEKATEPSAKPEKAIDPEKQVEKAVEPEKEPEKAVEPVGEPEKPTEHEKDPEKPATE